MRNFLTISILLICSLSFAQVPTNGLVAFWNFEGDANDQTLNQNHGVIMGPTFEVDRFGYADHCVSFDGVADVIEVASHPSFEFDAETDDYSISWWYNSADGVTVASSGRFFEKWDGILQTPYPHNIHLLTNDSVWGTCFNTSTTSKARARANFNGKWHHFVLVNNAQLNTQALYHDNILVDTKVKTITGSCANTAPFYMGNSAYRSRGYAGLLDDVRMYNRAVSDDDVDKLFNETHCHEPLEYTDSIFVDMGDSALIFGQYETTEGEYSEFISGWGGCDTLNLVYLTLNDTSAIDTTVVDTTSIDTTMMIQPLISKITLELKAYPNPSPGEVNLIMSENGDYMLTIINEIGQAVIREPFGGSKSVHLSVKGLYFAIIEDQNSDAIIRKKLLIQ